MNKAERLAQALRLMPRPALIVIAIHEADEIATGAIVAGLLQPWRGLHSQTIDGIPVAVAEIQETITMNYDLTISRVLF